MLFLVGPVRLVGAGAAGCGHQRAVLLAQQLLLIAGAQQLLGLVQFPGPVAQLAEGGLGAIELLADPVQAGLGQLLQPHAQLLAPPVQMHHRFLRDRAAPLLLELPLQALQLVGQLLVLRFDQRHVSLDAQLQQLVLRQSELIGGALRLHLQHEAFDRVGLSLGRLAGFLGASCQTVQLGLLLGARGGIQDPGMAQLLDGQRHLRLGQLDAQLVQREHPVDLGQGLAGRHQRQHLVIDGLG